MLNGRPGRWNFSKNSNRGFLRPFIKIVDFVYFFIYRLTLFIVERYLYVYPPIELNVFLSRGVLEAQKGVLEAQKGVLEA